MIRRVAEDDVSIKIASAHSFPVPDENLENRNKRVFSFI